MKQTLSSTILFLAIALLSFSCVKQELDICEDPETPVVEERETRLYIDFDDLQSRASSNEDVEEIWVYVFDGEGYYVELITDELPDIVSPEYYLLLDLEPGDYTFVGWSNLHSCYNAWLEEPVPGETTMEEFLIDLQTDQGDTVSVLQNLLHHGIVETATIREDRLYHEFHMYIRNNVYTVNVYTVGMEPDDYDYGYRITDYNARYNFFNEVITEKVVNYVTEVEKDSDGQLYGTLRVLRLIEENIDATLTITNLDTGRDLFTAQLIELILSLRKIGVAVDFDKIFEYTIRIEFRGGVVIGIDVNGWRVYSTDYEI